MSFDYDIFTQYGRLKLLCWYSNFMNTKMFINANEYICKVGLTSRCLTSSNSSTHISIFLLPQQACIYCKKIISLFTFFDMIFTHKSFITSRIYQNFATCCINFFFYYVLQQLINFNQYDFCINYFLTTSINSSTMILQCMSCFLCALCIQFSSFDQG